MSDEYTRANFGTGFETANASEADRFVCGKPFLDIWMDSWELCARPWGHTGGCDR